MVNVLQRNHHNGGRFGSEIVASGARWFGASSRSRCRVTPLVPLRRRPLGWSWPPRGQSLLRTGRTCTANEGTAPSRLTRRKVASPLSMTAIRVENVYKVFGRRPQEAVRRLREGAPR